MVKHLYWIRTSTLKPEEYDPNIRNILNEIRRGLYYHAGEYEFTVRVIVDDYMESDYLNRTVNAFFEDLINEDNPLHALLNDENCSDYIGELIQHIIYKPTFDAQYLFDGFLRNRPYGLVVKFYIPKERISEEKHEEFLGLGPDDLLAVLTVPEAVRYFLPYLYYYLDFNGLLEKAEYRDLWNYQIGLG